MIFTFIWSISLCKISQLQESEMRPTGWTFSYSCELKRQQLILPVEYPLNHSPVCSTSPFTRLKYNGAGKGQKLARPRSFSQGVLVVSAIPGMVTTGNRRLTAGRGLCAKYGIGPRGGGGGGIWQIKK